MADIDTILHRIPPDQLEGHPNRCVSVGPQGQCCYMAYPGATRCARHNGQAEATAEKKKDAKQYRLEQWGARVGELADHDKVKSLRDEIGITRMLLEATLNKCTDVNELLLYTPKISLLTGQLEKLVVSCTKLEQSGGMLMDKSAALALAGKIVDIIGKYVADGDTIAKISTDIIEEIK